MTKRFPTDYLGNSPSTVAGSLTADDYVLVAKSNGDSPRTYTIMVIAGDDIGGGGSTTTAEALTKTANFTVATADAGKVYYVDMSGMSPLADLDVTIPTNASDAIPVGSLFNLVLKNNGGASPANKVTITGDTGVTVNGTVAGSVDIEGNYSAGAIHKIGTNEWTIVGGIS